MTTTPAVLDSRSVEGLPNASRLINYNEDGLGYDAFRRPIATDLQAQCVERACDRLGIPLESAHVAALCCGTGANEQQMLKYWAERAMRLGKITALDGAANMLKHVPAKLQPFDAEVTTDTFDIVAGSLPFDEASLDAATIIQAVQHFDHADRHFPNMKLAFGKVRAKLKTGGSLVIISSCSSQARKARWYALAGSRGGLAHHEDPGYLHSQEFPRTTNVVGHLEGSGFEVVGMKTLKGPYVDTSVYYDPEWIFDPNAQKAVSFFSLAKRRGVLDKYLDMARGQIDSGEMLGVIEESERYRNEFGVAYLVEAVAV